MTEKKEFTKRSCWAADEIYFVPEGTPLSTQLVKFQRNKKKVGLVVDEYGDIQGWSPSKIFLKRLSATSPPPCHPLGGSNPAQRRHGDYRQQRQRSRNQQSVAAPAEGWSAHRQRYHSRKALEEDRSRHPRAHEQYDIDILDVTGQHDQTGESDAGEIITRASRSSASEGI